MLLVVQVLELAEEGWEMQCWGIQGLLWKRTGWIKELRDIGTKSSDRESMVFDEHHMDGHRKYRQENSKIHISCLYLPPPHRTEWGNPMQLVHRSQFTLHSTAVTVYSPVSLRGGVVATMSGGGVRGVCEAAAANGRGEDNAHEQNKQDVLSLHAG